MNEQAMALDMISRLGYKKAHETAEYFTDDVESKATEYWEKVLSIIEENKQ